MPRVTDVYAALPSITGKFELEYEGELRGAEQVARDLIRVGGRHVFTGMFDGVDTRTVVEWFDLGGIAAARATRSSADEVIAQTRGVQGLRELAERAGARAGRRRAGASRRRSTSCSKGSTRRRRSAAATSAATPPPKPRRAAPPRREEPTLDEEIRMPRRKKKYYN